MRDPANYGDAPQHVNFVSASPGLRGRQPLLVEGDAEARRLAQLQPAVPLVEGLGQQVVAALQAPLRRVAGELDEGRLAEARSEEHTSELQSLMRISYAVFCLKKKKTNRLKETATVIRTNNKHAQQKKNENKSLEAL